MRRALRSSKVKVGPSVGVMVIVGRGRGVKVGFSGSAEVGEAVWVGSMIDADMSDVGIPTTDSCGSMKDVFLWLRRHSYPHRLSTSGRINPLTHIRCHPHLIILTSCGIIKAS
jgi:hypothetical protein